MQAISGAVARLIALCALFALTERIATGAQLRLISALLMMEALLDILGALLKFT
ncbi:hypothetical protein ACH6CV_09610 [Bacillota bacterium Meth-B3]|nr:hypothetical protein [Christensenellaceae bacterium]MEA5070220.1 hypothetical protein [Christensenellaceae bacterium]